MRRITYSFSYKSSWCGTHHKDKFSLFIRLAEGMNVEKTWTKLMCPTFYRSLDRIPTFGVLRTFVTSLNLLGQMLELLIKIRRGKTPTHS